MCGEKQEQEPKEKTKNKLYFFLSHLNTFRSTEMLKMHSWPCSSMSTFLPTVAKEGKRRWGWVVKKGDDFSRTLA